MKQNSSSSEFLDEFFFIDMVKRIMDTPIEIPTEIIESIWLYVIQNLITYLKIN